MELLVWSDKFSVSIAKIDSQHQKLISMINELNEDIEANKTSTLLSKIINDLIEYINVHFTTEEELFEEYKFSGAAEHIEEHLQFINKLAGFIKNYSAGDALLAKQILDYLKTWFIEHIQGTDMKYVDFFSNKGLT